MGAGNTIALIKALAGSGGGSGTSNYNSLSNRPQINGTTLSGDKSGSDLGLLDAPSTAGTSGQVLTSDGQGGMSWQTPSGGSVSDVQVNGTSVVSNGVANVPVAGYSTFGVAKFDDSSFFINSSSIVKINRANDSQVKMGTDDAKPIVPNYQHKATFYGLAKAAGADEKDSTLPFGTYSASAKAAIQSMLGVEPGVSFVETVSGTTPTIPGEANVRYICGEVSTLSITPPVAGTIVVRFTSGSTATVLTLPQTVVFPEGVDLTTLDANTVYEIMITDGVYGGVMTWAVSA